MTLQCLKRETLFFSILRVLSIDVGRILARKILLCAKRKQGKLFFPNLITALCLRAQVQVEKDEEVLMDNGIIDSTSLARLQGASKGRKSTNNIVCGIHELLKQPRRMMQHMEHNEVQQKLYWEYAHQRDYAMEKAFEFGSEELPQPFSQFPEGVLNPWCPSSSMEKMMMLLKVKKIEEGKEGSLLLLFACYLYVLYLLLLSSVFIFCDCLF